MTSVKTGHCETDDRQRQVILTHTLVQRQKVVTFTFEVISYCRLTVY